MPKLIKDGVVVEDKWSLEGLPSNNGSLQEAACDFGNKDDVIVSIDRWLVERDQLLARERPVGIWLEGSQVPSLLSHDLHRFPVIAVNFPVFSDGRGFSIGTLLRERCGYTGELRAVGNILLDQLFYLQRCGFNAFSMAESVDLTAACAALSDFSESYQQACDQRVPLFRRR